MQIIYSPRFVRQFKKLPEGLQDEVLQKIELFKNPKNHKILKVHKLHGILAVSESFSVNFKTRIVFERLNRNEIAFLAIGDHTIYG